MAGLAGPTPTALSCKLMNVQFLEYGFYGENLWGKSYLNDIIIHLIELPLCCYSGIYIMYRNAFSAMFPHDKSVLMINRISMSSIDNYIRIIFEVWYWNMYTIVRRIFKYPNDCNQQFLLLQYEANDTIYH